jgi:DNA-binding GntR family transcriptional regulator
VRIDKNKSKEIHLNTSSRFAHVAAEKISETADLTLSGKAYFTLSTMIQERNLPSGTLVIEQQLAEMLKISRTPLRKDLQRIEIEGLILKTSNRSYVVRKVELKEYLQSLKVRELVEAEAAFLSAKLIPVEKINIVRKRLHEVQKQTPYDMLSHWSSDDEVHNLFIQKCGNEIMISLIQSLRVTTKLFEIERLFERLDPDSYQHEAILDALQAADPGASRRAVASHIRSLFKFAIKTVG